MCTYEVVGGEAWDAPCFDMDKEKGCYSNQCGLFVYACGRVREGGPLGQQSVLRKQTQ